MNSVRLNSKIVILIVTRLQGRKAYGTSLNSKIVILIVDDRQMVLHADAGLNSKIVILIVQNKRDSKLILSLSKF